MLGHVPHVPNIDAIEPHSDATYNLLNLLQRDSAPQYIDLYGTLGIDTGTLSGLHKFEGPDPAFWCAHGYAVCNPDPRGSYNSEGDIRVWSRQEGQDYHDLIEWIGVQDWCNGKVGTTGNSYLAISQSFVAAEQPPQSRSHSPLGRDERHLS